MNKTITKSVLLIFLMVFVCAMPVQALAKTELTEIVITDNGWDSQRLHNEIARLIVENAYDGYVIKMSTASTTMNWQAIIAGDVDVDIESWTDNFATYPKDVANGDIVNVGILASDGKQGLYVPRYVIEGDAKRGIKPLAPDLKTVKDLAKYHNVFRDDEDKNKGKIYGAIPGWLADGILHSKYELYGLDKNYNYARLGSEATIFATLVSAYNLGEPWVGYCYEPTWVAGKLDIVLLEDEPYTTQELYLKGGSEFPSQELKIVSSKYFAKKAPDLLEFFKKYKTGSKLISEALAYIDENKVSHTETAKWLLKTNDHLLDQWLPKERADRVRAIL
ncbi:MAG: ABC transporter substrate-binding protein [Synergistaceae bacterium]|nr:ABC transporter substrate-binding protein [Synergistaceae bacterium]